MMAKLKPYEKCPQCGNIKVGVKALIFSALVQVVFCFGFALKWFTHWQPYANALIIGSIIGFLLYMVFYALMQGVIDEADRKMPTLTIQCNNPLTTEDIQRIREATDWLARRIPKEPAA